VSLRSAITAYIRLPARDVNGEMRAAGFEVYDPDMTIFTQAGGGIHCVCQPLRRESRLRTFRSISLSGVA